MVIKMTRTLMEEGWAFISNESEVVIRAEHSGTGEAISFNSVGNLKRWLYEKALSY
jgi:hypothetical protein